MKRTIIIITTVAAIIVASTLLLSAAMSRKLTLYSDSSITRITANGASIGFSQGLKIDYSKAVTITVAQDGYDYFSQTLDPAKDKISSFTIKLTKTSNSPVGSTNYNLLQAAQTDPDNLGIITNSKLNVTVVDQKTFSKDYALYFVKPTTGSGDTGTVILQKKSDGYHIILGPGTIFDQTDLAGLPSDLSGYLKTNGMVSTAQ